MVSGGAQDQQIKKKRKIKTYVSNANKKNIKHNLSESDSENKIIEFLRFIVIESLEETPLAKLSPFLIEKWSTEQTLKLKKKN